MPKKGNILIIGAGVNGLTCAYALLKENFGVVIVAKDFPPKTTSNVAGALWEWPPAVCGFYDSKSFTDISNQKIWASASYHKFKKLSKFKTQTGVHFRKVNFYYPFQIESDPNEYKKLKELQAVVLGFKHSALLIKKNGVADSNIVDCYQYKAPVIDTDIYLKWLLNEVKRSGCRMYQQDLKGELREHIAALKTAYNVDYIINCSGLGAYEFGDSSMFPVEGGLLRIKNSNRAGKKMEEAHCTSVFSKKDTQFIFIVPRGEDLISLGGYALPNKNFNDTRSIQMKFKKSILKKCSAFLPELKEFPLALDSYFVLGSRPFRKMGIRLEYDSELENVIHNYGHGGSGVLLSWGCAEQVVNLIAAKSTT